jgi:transposase
MYLCTLLIQGAKSVLWSAHKRNDPISRGVCSLRKKHGWPKGAVALTGPHPVCGDDQGAGL